MQTTHTQATVTLLVNEKEQIGLARKKQAIHEDKEKGGDEIAYSLGMYNGYGGKREVHDLSIFHAAIRENFGEASITSRADDLELVARVYFWKPRKGTGEMVLFMEVFFFLLRSWKGEPKESSEMGPTEWFSPEEIPYHNMMPADKHIFELILKGERPVLEVWLPGKDIPPEIRAIDEPLLRK